MLNARTRAKQRAQDERHDGGGQVQLVLLPAQHHAELLTRQAQCCGADIGWVQARTCWRASSPGQAWAASARGKGNERTLELLLEAGGWR